MKFWQILRKVRGSDPAVDYIRTIDDIDTDRGRDLGGKRAGTTRVYGERDTMIRETFCFVVPLVPRPQLRHRDRRGGKGKYDPSADDKAIFRAHALPYRPSRPLTGPIVLACRFMFSRAKAKRAKGETVLNRWREAKPDLDNLYKLVQDALEGLFFMNDRQIVSHHFSKWPDGKFDTDLQPGTQVCIASVMSSTGDYDA